MRTAVALALSAVFMTLLMGVACAQDLAPRAYVIGPIHANAVILTYSFNHGDIFFNIFRRAPKLRREASIVGVARRQYLVRW